MGLFIMGLVASGVTAFPLLSEMKWATHFMGLDSASSPAGFSGLSFWLLTVRFGLEDIYQRYPWIAYGTDWLAFGHIVIALFFVAALFRPRESRSILYVGILACGLVIPLAFICGPIRGIPFYWRVIDSSFGLLGVLPLLYSLRLLRRIEQAVPAKRLGSQ
jgi:hypothetical protein